MITFEKYIAFFIASIFMGAIIIGIPAIADTIATCYLGVIGAFLAIDLTIMLKKTSELPKGDFKNMNKSRYYLSLLITFCLFGIACYCKSNLDYQIMGTILMLATCIMTIISLYIGGLEGNKLMTQMGQKSSEDEPK
jgi:hypothetical protein